MDIQIYLNHNKLIPFYSLRGIEIADKFENEPVFSYVIKEHNKIIAAVTCSKVDSVYIIEAIAVNKKSERKGLGTHLLKYVLKKLELVGAKEIILNAKNTAFFEKNGFIVINRHDVPVDAYAYCFECPNFEVNCFPKIMKFQQ